jgi:hypothetical protein
LTYAEILSGHPDLLFVLTVQRLVMGEFRLRFSLELLGLSYRVFQPFIGFADI